MDVHAGCKEPKLENFYKIFEDNWATYQISEQDGYEVFPVTEQTLDLDDQEVGLDMEEGSSGESPAPGGRVDEDLSTCEVTNPPSSFVPPDVDPEVRRAAMQARVDALKPLIPKSSHKISISKGSENHIRLKIHNTIN